MPHPLLIQLLLHKLKRPIQPLTPTLTRPTFEVHNQATNRDKILLWLRRRPRKQERRAVVDPWLMCNAIQMLLQPLDLFKFLAAYVTNPAGAEIESGRVGRRLCRECVWWCRDKCGIHEALLARYCGGWGGGEDYGFLVLRQCGGWDWRERGFVVARHGGGWDWGEDHGVLMGHGGGGGGRKDYSSLVVRIAFWQLGCNRSRRRRGRRYRKIWRGAHPGSDLQDHIVRVVLPDQVINPLPSNLRPTSPTF